VHLRVTRYRAQHIPGGYVAPGCFSASLHASMRPGAAVAAEKQGRQEQAPRAEKGQRRENGEGGEAGGCSWGGV